MQTTLTANSPDGKTVVGWLHRAKPDNDKLIVLCHGHNSDGQKGRFIELAKYFNSSGIDFLRWSVTRKKLAPGVFEVTTISEEVSQANSLVKMLRDKYRIIVAAGHSQGGIMALMLAQANLANGVVQLMSVADENIHIQKNLPRFELAKNEAGFAIYTSPSTKMTVGYTKAFFDDYSQWHLKEILASNTKPILFFLARNDRMVSAEEIRAGFEVAGGNKDLVEVDGEHDFSNEVAEVIAKTILQWMQTKLQ